jgi:GNAT superfamily N-acetyltransferase
MIVKAKNNSPIQLRKLMHTDFDSLFDYLQKLSPETRKRFGPHPFDKQSVIDFYQSSGKLSGYIAIDIETNEIVAYSIIKIGFLEHDSFRLQSYGLNLNIETDCTFAPSVADLWQSQGVGTLLFRFILSDLEDSGIKRIILWGGVQSDNEKAVNFYWKHGFIILGQFEYNGLNFDMMLNINLAD